MSLLALGPKSDRLQQGGLRTLGDLLDDSGRDFAQLRSLPALGGRTVQLVQERLGAVLSCVRLDGQVDWQAFGHLCGIIKTIDTAPAMPLSEADRAVPVWKLHLGARASRIAAGGLVSTGALFDDKAADYRQLKQVPRLGDAAVALTDRRLRTLDVCRGPQGDVDWEMFDAVCRGKVITPPATRPTASTPSERQPLLLSPQANERPVEVLRLGPKAKFLRQANLSTIGHLMREGVLSGLSRLEGIGPSTAEIIRTRLSDLTASVDETGQPQWDAVAAIWGYPVLPDRPLPTGEAFLETAADVIEQWIKAHVSEADRLILSVRLVRPREGRLTLDEIGQQLNVTRQRVKQREEKLLDGLCAALLADDQSRSPVQFSTDFRSWWQRAGAALSEIEVLTWPAFVSGLERAWGGPSLRLTAILPLALAVLTDGGQVAPPRTPIPPRLFQPLSATLLQTSIRNFPVGRALGDLETAGCISFGTLLLGAMENRMPQGRSGITGARLLAAVAKAVGSTGELDSAAFATAMEMPLLPDLVPETPDVFLGVFDACAERAVGLGRTTERASDIWRIRTRQPAAVRPTLEETGTQLGTWGPSIKREETLLLAALNAQLVDGEQVNAGVIWRREFVDRVVEAASVRDEAAGDFDAFVYRLSARWLIDAALLRRQVAGLWAVLSLYPGGRRRAVKDRSASSVPDPGSRLPPAGQEGVIVLRGFRRLH